MNTRNPNLSALPLASIPNTISATAGSEWWTGLPPSQCQGYSEKSQTLHALPLLQLETCTREDVLNYFDNSWTLTEVLFSSLKSEQAFRIPPYHQLRHPLIFYYGHPAVLYLNKLRVAGLVQNPIDLYLEKVLEVGVDEMSWDDLSKNEMDWPSVKAVRDYRRKVYSVISSFIKTTPLLDKPLGKINYLNSPLWALFMGFEHEKIHLETSSVLIRELPLELVEEPKYWPPRFNTSKISEAQRGSESLKWASQKGGQVVFGKRPNTPSYGWDNEYGERSATITDFQFTETQITNLQYFEFVKSGAYIDDSYWSPEGLQWRKFRNVRRPTFWAASGPEGSHEYKLRTLFEMIDMPWDWPAEVNFHEAQAYCRWRNKKDESNLHYRLFTEAEVRALVPQSEDPILTTYENNFNLKWGSPGPASKEIYGNVWHWLEDQFNPLTNFKVHPYYDDFSTPCFDGKHQMIMGGSFVSCGHEASVFARFHFRPHFYQHAGFRMAASLDGSKDNQSTKLVIAEKYTHPKRVNVLDQMSASESWWKSVEQPLRLSVEEQKLLFEQTERKILEFETQYEKMSPMGQAHDPKLNSVPLGYKLPYQSTRDFPVRGESFEKLLNFVFDEMAPLSQLPGHPGYAAYVAGGGNAISNLGQLISQTLNPFTGHYMMAPGLVTLEAEVINWMVRVMGYPENTASGFLTSGSSLATLSALSMARNKVFKDSNFSLATLYVSQHGHHCISKAWRYLGLPSEGVRFVPVNAKFQMDVHALSKMIEQDLKKGLKPVALVGSAGTTNTGAVDDLNALSEIAKKNKIWYHVDGAYGGLFRLTEKGKDKLSGLEKSDSVAFDLHKALALSYGTGCLLVRDRSVLRTDYPGSKTYMPPEIDEDEMNLKVDYADITPELSRDYRGLRVWLPIKALGIGPFILNLEEKLKLSEWLNQEISKVSKLEVIAQPQLSIQAFAVNSERTIEENNRKTQELLEKINLKGTFFVSSCMIGDRKCIRICLLGFRMNFNRLQTFVNEMKDFLT